MIAKLGKSGEGGGGGRKKKECTVGDSINVAKVKEGRNVRYATGAISRHSEPELASKGTFKRIVENWKTALTG